MIRKLWILMFFLSLSTPLLILSVETENKKEQEGFLKQEEQEFLTHLRNCSNKDAISISQLKNYATASAILDLIESVKYLAVSLGCFTVKKLIKHQLSPSNKKTRVLMGTLTLLSSLSIFSAGMYTGQFAKKATLFKHLNFAINQDIPKSDKIH